MKYYFTLRNYDVMQISIVWLDLDQAYHAKLEGEIQFSHMWNINRGINTIDK